MTKKQPTIIRAPRSTEHHYFVSRRATAQDESLSWEARGVLWYLLSKPDNWEVKPSDLEQNCGRQKVYAILKELAEHGYLERQQGVNEKNQFTPVEYTVHEVPCDENQHTEKPRDEKPHRGKPLTANQHHTYKENLTDQESLQKPLSPPDGGDAVAQEREKPAPQTEQQQMFEAICMAFGYDIKQLTLTKKRNVGKVASELRAAGALPEQIPGFYVWCKKQGWTGFGPNAFSAHWDDYRATLRTQTPVSTEPTGHEILMGLALAAGGDHE